MTFALFVAALLASTVAFSGSSQPSRSSSAVGHLHHTRD
jgi:hypothetical protein